MITYTKEDYSGRLDRVDDNGFPIKYKEGSCLSSDTKPTDCENGSTLLEMDTGKVYVYDAENSTWREL